MKNLRTTACCVCFMLYSLCLAAQNNQSIPINEPDRNKPKLFQHLPDFIPVNIENLDNLLGSPAGRSINANLSTETPLQFEGQVVSASSKYGNSLSSVVIRSTNFNGATLTISRITNADGTIQYAGRIISFQHGDLYELQKRENRIFLVKRNFYDLINE